MKVKVTAVFEMEFPNLQSDMPFDDKNYVIRNKTDKLIACGGGNCKEMYWEEVK